MPRPRVIVLLLALATLLAYLPATHDRFINYDDDDYITQNPVVQKGLTWASQMGLHHLARQQLASAHLAFTHDRL